MPKFTFAFFHSVFAKSTRGSAGHFCKHTGKMFRRGKAALAGDVLDGNLCKPQQLLCGINPVMAQIFHGRHTELFQEKLTEGGAVRPAVGHDIGAGDFVHIMGLDEKTARLTTGFVMVLGWWSTISLPMSLS